MTDTLTEGSAPIDHTHPNLSEEGGRSGQRPAPIHLVVHGKAETQGSKTPVHRNGKTWMTEGTGSAPQRRKAWRQAVADHARLYQSVHNTPLISGPVVVAMRFWLEKPASAPKRRRTWPKGGDVDKLARSCADSLTHTLLANDSQIVAMLLTKDYGDPPRVEIDIEPVPPECTGASLAYELEGVDG